MDSRARPLSPSHSLEWPDSEDQLCHINQLKILKPLPSPKPEATTLKMGPVNGPAGFLKRHFQTPVKQSTEGLKQRGLK